MNFSDLQKKKPSDLEKELEKKREELRLLRSALSAASHDVKAIRTTKRAIAQIMTALGNVEVAGQSA